MGEHAHAMTPPPEPSIDTQTVQKLQDILKSVEASHQDQLASAVKSAIGDIKYENRTLMTEVHTLRNQVEHTHAMIHTKDNRIQNLENNLIIKEDRIQNLENNLIIKEDRVLEVENDLSIKEDRILDIEKQLDVIPRQRNSQIKELKVKNTNKGKRIRDLEKASTENSRDFEVQKALKNNRIEELQTQVVELKSLGHDRQRAVLENEDLLSKALEKNTVLEEKLKKKERLLEDYKESKRKWKDRALSEPDKRSSRRSIRRYF